MATTKYVAYCDLGAGIGAMVNPDDYGGVDNENFKYMLEHRSIVPLSDPDAAIALGRAVEVELTPDTSDEEIAALRLKVAELEAEREAAEAAKQEEPPAPPAAPPAKAPEAKAPAAPAAKSAAPSA